MTMRSSSGERLYNANEDSGAGIPPNIYGRLQDALSECPAFDNDRSLKAVFVDERISPWRKGLPQAISLKSRVLATIDFLRKRYNDKQENALTLLLCVLADLTDPRDALHRRLVELADELDREIGNQGHLMDAYMAIHVSREITTDTVEQHRSVKESEQYVDAWGMASVKSIIDSFSEIVAKDAAAEAALASSLYGQDPLIMLIPLVFDLRWQRGYESGLKRLLNLPKPKKHLRDFQCREVSPPCPIMEGLLSAEREGTEQVLVRLDEHAAVLIGNLRPREMQMVLNSVNRWGRLGRPSTGGLSLLERIGEIPVDTESEHGDLETVLFRNREALVPIIARLGMPGDEWLLPEEEEFPALGEPFPRGMLPDQGDQEGLSYAQHRQSKEDIVEEEDFVATHAVQQRIGASEPLRLEDMPEEIRRIIESQLRRRSRRG
jgi:hypothetical protein